MTRFPDALSETVQMYLVAIVRLGEENHPVPLSKLAEEFSISASSVNEMCRKLEKDGYLVYQPYKGVTLTKEGREKANYILRRHRLWEVFLAEKLGFNYKDAHNTACQLEHATTDFLADQLDLYLENPLVNPLGEPIPPGHGDYRRVKSLPLTHFSPGQRVHVLSIENGEQVEDYLAEHGIRPGNVIFIQAVSNEDILLKIDGGQIAIDKDLAQKINVVIEKNR